MEQRAEKKTFFTNPFFILQNCFVKDEFLLENNMIDKQHPLLVYSEIYSDVAQQIIGTGFDEDIKKSLAGYEIIKKEDLGLEFFYTSDDWIHLEGKRFKNIRKNINHFLNSHSCSIHATYPEEKVMAFLQNWADEKRKKETSTLTKELFEHELEESKNNIKLVKKINHKAIYLEENGELLGFCIFFKYYDSFWIALLQKTTFNIQGLPQYLYHLKAKEMGSKQMFTTGAESQDENLKKFKESLRPHKIKKIYTIHIGDHLQKSA